MRIIIGLFTLIILASCSDNVPRRPISQKSGSYINSETITRNRERVAQEEEYITNFVTKDSLNDYITSSSGFWYSYVTKDTLGAASPKVGDLVLFNYNIATINGKELVKQETLGNTVTQIDQSNQELISGIREGLKLMNEGETITFLFPSYKAYGYYGYEDKVPSNTPVRSTVTLLEIKDQTKD